MRKNPPQPQPTITQKNNSAELRDDGGNKKKESSLKTEQPKTKPVRGKNGGVRPGSGRKKGLAKENPYQERSPLSFGSLCKGSLPL